MSEPPDRPRFDTIADAERHERPTLVRPLTFVDLATPGPRFRNTRHLVTIESVRAGDEQVFAARGDRFGDPLVDLDVLDAFPSVRSVVASTTVRARRPLPAVIELLLFGMTPLPDAETLDNLSSLKRLWAGWAPGRSMLEVSHLPVDLDALAICRHNLPSPSAGSRRFEELARFASLRHLELNDCWPQDNLAALAPLHRLERLRADATSGWSALRTCVALRRVAAIKPRIASLRAWKTWTRLRQLTLTGSGIGTIDGLNAFSALEQLRLVMLKITDLAPLGGLPRLADVELTGLNRVNDLAPLGTLPSLRRLIVARAGGEYQDIVHVASIRPLSTAVGLEEVRLEGAVIDDGDLAPLAALPALKRLTVFGDLEGAVDALRTKRPDVDIIWHRGPTPPGERVGIVFLRPPAAGLRRWWIREDLADRLNVRTNADAEARLRAALGGADAALLARLEFDTEADAVTILAQDEAELRVVAAVIERLAKNSTDQPGRSSDR